MARRGEVRKIRMGGAEYDPPFKEATGTASGDFWLHALLNPALAGEAGATIVVAAAGVAAGWWEKQGVGGWWGK